MNYPARVEPRLLLGKPTKSKIRTRGQTDFFDQSRDLKDIIKGMDSNHRKHRKNHEKSENELPRLG